MILSWGTQAARGASAFFLIYGAVVFVAAILMRAIGWRVIDSANYRVSEKGIEQAARQFSLRELLIWTALSGGLLFVLKQLAPDFTRANDSARLIIYLSSIAVINLAAMWGALGTWHSLARGPLSILAIVLAGLAISQVIPGPEVTSVIAFLVIMLLNLFIVFLLFRFLGYRLVWRQPWKMAK